MTGETPWELDYIKACCGLILYKVNRKAKYDFENLIKIKEHQRGNNNSKRNMYNDTERKRGSLTKDHPHLVSVVED